HAGRVDRGHDLRRRAPRLVRVRARRAPAGRPAPHGLRGRQRDALEPLPPRRRRDGGLDHWTRGAAQPLPQRRGGDSVSGRVAGKVVVVTGAAGGQGAAEAAWLAREGATVVAADVSDAPDVRRLDVSRAEDWAELAAWLEGEYGRVDGLVNNAG